MSSLRQRRVLYNDGALYLADVAGGSFEHPSLVNIRPLTIEFFREIAAYLKEQHEGCPCKLTGAFNLALGCEKAAAMHLEEGKKYKRIEYFDHFHEEDVIEVPLMIAFAKYDPVLEEYASKITADHVMFRATPYSEWETVIGEKLGQHADLEDQAMVRMIRVMQRLIA